MRQPRGRTGDLAKGVADGIRRRWRSAAIGAVLGALLAVAGSLLSPKVYEARSDLFIQTTVAGGVENGTQLVTAQAFAQERVKSYAAIATNDRVLTRVIEQLGLDAGPDVLRRASSAEADVGSVVLTVRVRNQEPALAAEIASAIASQTAIVAAEIERPRFEAPTPISARVLGHARSPGEQVSPDISVNTVAGALAGALAGVTFAGLRRRLSRTLTSEADLSALIDAPVLARIPRHRGNGSDRLSGARRDAFGMARTNLSYVTAVHATRILTIAGCHPGDSAATTWALAQTISDGGNTVCVVDANLRSPGQHAFHGLSAFPGLTEILIGEISLEQAVQRVPGSRISVLGAGSVPPNPSELLASESMVVGMARLGREFDLVLVDTPTLTGVTDAALVAGRTKTAILVVSLGRSTKHAVGRAVDRLSATDTRIAGIILLEVRGSTSD
ncbi:hypothetical protein N802_00205 [Knoellia sinensis KCTC 19936]|uniref:Polysaccharide chain length determinant N-terminal domain-containing protein n=1 Tax=Knoellia sinensis KCTC 19936 TaxID=1385520 RepID=A0A0A0JCV7_9MICO|nr:polysaccharide biosynthesis tyrosine autokinase [Knoellia sinensis]KGN34973.1 hypothetical protein N802_00205 [Knoellia sinensis KCTC 19936]